MATYNIITFTSDKIGIFTKQAELTFKHPFIWMACTLSFPENKFETHTIIRV